MEPTIDAVARFIVPYGARQDFTQALAEALHGRPVKAAAYPNPFPPRLGLLFKAGTPPICLECSALRYGDTLRISVFLCIRTRAAVDLLTVIPGGCARYIYPATTDIDQIAQDVAGRFWETMRLDVNGPSKGGHAHAC